MKHILTVAAVLTVAVTVAWAEGDGQGAGAGGPPHTGPANLQEHFKQLDKNGNGVIDKDEFKGPAEMFAKIDTDNSGTLTLDEMKAARPKRMENRGNLEERFKQMDKNGNGVIDKDEFKGPPERFAKIDTDNSGTLSKEELKAARPPFRGHGPGNADQNAAATPAPAPAAEKK
jgi:Ca2+-binding EF-hand superfamily protein